MESLETGDEIKSCSRSSRTTVTYRVLRFVKKALSEIQKCPAFSEQAGP